MIVELTIEETKTEEYVIKKLKATEERVKEGKMSAALKQIDALNQFLN
jgi:hypothetical protein